MNHANACASHLNDRIDAQERQDALVSATVGHWKKAAENSRYESDLSKEIECVVINHIADPYGFVHLALMAQLSGKGAEFLESQLKALAMCEVDHE